MAVIHPLVVRLVHWLNALAIVVLIVSGLQIRGDYPILPFAVPAWLTPGGWLGDARSWHFAAMWVLAANGLVYLVRGFASGRFRRKLLPLLAHADLSGYNAVRKFSHAFVIAMGVLVVASGLALWKPVQFGALTRLFGGCDAARVVHLAAMAGIFSFMLMRVAMSLLVPRSLLAVVRGR